MGQPASRDARHLFRLRFEAWRREGLSARACGVLALTGCDTIEQIRDLGRAWFEGRPNVGAKTLQELALVAGWPVDHKSPLDAIAAALKLSIPNPAQAREAAADALIGLRQAGFVVAVTHPAAAGSRRSTPAHAANTPSGISDHGAELDVSVPAS